MADFSINTLTYNLNSNSIVSPSQINDLKTKMEWNGNNTNKEMIYDAIINSYTHDNSMILSNSNTIPEKKIIEKKLQERLLKLILNIITTNQSNLLNYILGDLYINHNKNTSPTMANSQILDLIPSVLSITKIQNLAENFKKVFNEFYQSIIQEGKKIKDQKQSPNNAFEKLSSHFFKAISDLNYSLSTANKISIDIEELFSDQNISIADNLGNQYKNIFDFFSQKLKKEAINDLNTTKFKTISETSNYLKDQIKLLFGTKFNFSNWSSPSDQYNNFLSQLIVSDEETQKIIKAAQEYLYNSNGLIYFEISKYTGSLDSAIGEIINHTGNGTSTVLSDAYLKTSKLLEKISLGLFDAFLNQQQDPINTSASTYVNPLDSHAASSVLSKQYPVATDQGIINLLVQLKLIPPTYSRESFASLLNWLKTRILIQGASIKLQPYNQINLPYRMNTLDQKFYSKVSPANSSIQKKLILTSVERASIYLNQVIQSSKNIIIKDIDIFNKLADATITNQEKLIIGLANSTELKKDFLFEILNSNGYTINQTEYDLILNNSSLVHNISFKNSSTPELEMTISDSVTISDSTKVPKITFEFHDSLKEILQNNINAGAQSLDTNFIDRNFWLNTTSQQITYNDWVINKMGISNQVNVDVAAFNVQNNTTNFLNASKLLYTLTSPLTPEIQTMSQNKTSLSIGQLLNLDVDVNVQNALTRLSFKGTIPITISSSFRPQDIEAEEKLKEFIEDKSGDSSKYDPNANGYIKDDASFETWVTTWQAQPSSQVKLKDLIQNDLGVENQEYIKFIDKDIKKILGLMSNSFTVVRPDFQKTMDQKTNVEVLLRQVVFKYLTGQNISPVNGKLGSGLQDFIEIVVTLFDDDSWKKTAIENLKKNQQDTLNVIQSSDKIPDEWKNRIKEQIEGDSLNIQDMIMNNPNMTKTVGVGLVAAAILKWKDIFNKSEIKDFSFDKSFGELDFLFKAGIPPEILKLLADSPDFLDRLLSVKASEKMLMEIANNKKLLNSIKDLNIENLKSFIKATTGIYKNKKYAYLGIGAGSGLLAVSSGVIAVTSILSNKRINKINNSLKMSKKRRRLIPIVSSLISISLIAISTSFTLFFFINQGGF